MKLVYWGTGAAEGIPAIFCDCPTCQKARELGGKEIRTRAQMLIDDRLLIDLGPDTYAHALRYGANLIDVRSVFITHSHSDHFYAEDLVMRVEGYAHDEKHLPMHIYANEKTNRLYETLMDIYRDSDQMDRYVQFHRIQAFSPVTVDGYEIMPLPANHDAYENCLIFAIHSLAEDKWFLYGNDTTTFPEETVRWLENKRFDLVSLDCTCGAEETASTHMTLPLCRKLVARLREQGTIDAGTRVILTHFSHNAGLLHQDLCDMAQDDGFDIAYDGMTVTL